MVHFHLNIDKKTYICKSGSPTNFFKIYFMFYLTWLEHSNNIAEANVAQVALVKVFSPLQPNSCK